LTSLGKLHQGVDNVQRQQQHLSLKVAISHNALPATTLHCPKPSPVPLPFPRASIHVAIASDMRVRANSSSRKAQHRAFGVSYHGLTCIFSFFGVGSCVCTQLLCLCCTPFTLCTGIHVSSAKKLRVACSRLQLSSVKCLLSTQRTTLRNVCTDYALLYLQLRKFPIARCINCCCRCS
jgi:hypothetical protein